jgi:hypothetical protein
MNQTHPAEPNTFRTLALIVVLFAAIYAGLSYAFQPAKQTQKFPVQKEALVVSPSR